jgi:hypothetical protein
MLEKEKSFICLTSMVCLSALSTVAISQPINTPNQINRVSELIREKSTWANFDWKKPEDSKLVKANGWDSDGYEKKSDKPESNLKIVKRADIQIEDVWSEINYSERKDSQYRNYSVFVIYNSGFCNQLESWAQKVFGSPSIKIDTSYTLMDGLRAVNRDYQWNIGQKTTAILNCAGLLNADAVRDGKSSLISVLTITAYQDQRHLKQLIYLDCKVKQKAVQQASKNQDETLLQLVINENNNRVMNRMFEPIASDVELSTTFIKFNFLGSKNRKIKTEIDRLSGSYTGVLQIEDANNQNLKSVNLVGRCEATKSPKAIF